METVVEAGQTVQVRVRAATPAPAGKVVREGTVTALFWAPGTRPGTDPPARQARCRFDRDAGGWVAVADTSGWEPGVWVTRGSVATAGPDARTGWAWASFTVTS